MVRLSTFFMKALIEFRLLLSLLKCQLHFLVHVEFQKRLAAWGGSSDSWVTFLLLLPPPSCQFVWTPVPLADSFCPCRFSRLASIARWLWPRHCRPDTHLEWHWGIHLELTLVPLPIEKRESTDGSDTIYLLLIPNEAKDAVCLLNWFSLHLHYNK